MNFDSYYQSSEEKKTRKLETVQRLAHTLIESSKGEIEPYQAEERVRGILDRPLAEVIYDIKNAIQFSLPTKRNGRNVGYVLTLMTTHIQQDENGHPSTATIGVQPATHGELLIPNEETEEGPDKWVTLTNPNFDITLAELMGRSESFAPMRMIHLVAVEHDAKAVALMTSPIFRGQHLPAYRALSWSIRDGWLWEGEEILPGLGEDIPFDEAPALIKVIDDRRQSRLEAVFNVEMILNELQEKAPEGENHLINFTTGLNLPSHYSFIKNNEDVSLVEPFPGARSAMVDHMAFVLSTPGQKGRLVLQTRSDSIALSAWTYQQSESFLPVQPQDLQDIITENEERMGFRVDMGMEKKFPDPFTLGEKLA